MLSHLIPIAIGWLLIGASYQQQEPKVCGVEFSSWLQERPDLSAVTPFHEDSIHGGLERVRGPSLVYPDELRRAGWEGAVHVAAVIDTTGRVVHAEAMSSDAAQTRAQSGADSLTVQQATALLAQAAVDLIAHTEFSPGQYEGHPVSTVTCIQVQLTLLGTS